MAEHCSDCHAVKELVKWRDNAKSNVDKLIALIVTEDGNCPHTYGFPDFQGKCTDLECIDCWRMVLYGGSGENG